MVDKHCKFTHLKMGWDRPAHLKIGRPILRLSAKLRILKWASDNLKIDEILSLAPTNILGSNTQENITSLGVGIDLLRMGFVDIYALPKRIILYWSIKNWCYLLKVV